MEPRANTSDHRYSAGDMVEYGMGSPAGKDRLGRVVFERREYGQDGYLIQPLSITPGDGTLPSVYPARMVSDYQPARWAADGGNWHRTYAEIHAEPGHSCPRCGC